ncbi:MULTISPECIES: hypothetical protein [Rhizobium]|uniref:hypothetical protein n=1 Tax=Rhizobium TaxID=379 RepID=UPI0009399559
MKTIASPAIGALVSDRGTDLIADVRLTAPPRQFASMHADIIELLDKPRAPMGRMNVKNFAGHGVYPGVGDALAREDQRMNAFLVDHGELYILLEWSSDD